MLPFTLAGQTKSIPAVDVRVLAFTTRLTVSAQRINVEITMLTGVGVLIFPAPRVLQAGRLNVGTIPAVDITGFTNQIGGYPA